MTRLTPEQIQNAVQLVIGRNQVMAFAGGGTTRYNVCKLPETPPKKYHLCAVGYGGGSLTTLSARCYDEGGNLLPTLIDFAASNVYFYPRNAVYVTVNNGSYYNSTMEVIIDTWREVDFIQATNNYYEMFVGDVLGLPDIFSVIPEDCIYSFKAQPQDPESARYLAIRKSHLFDIMATDNTIVNCYLADGNTEHITQLHGFIRGLKPGVVTVTVSTSAYDYDTVAPRIEKTITVVVKSNVYQMKSTPFPLNFRKMKLIE